VSTPCNKEEAIKKYQPSDDITRELPEYYIDPDTSHSHIIHRSRKERIEDLEAEVKVLKKNISGIYRGTK
jgi:hypothetical protein